MFCELWLSQRYLRAGKKEKIISLTALISMIGIAIGVMVLIVVLSVMSGFDRFLEDKMVGTNAHLSLESYSGLRHPEKAMEQLKLNPHILGVSPFVAGQAFIRTNRQIFGIEVRGIDPKLQVTTSKIAEYLKSGSIDLNGNELLIGEELAWRLGVSLGDRLNLISPVTLAKTEFTIKGLFNSGMYLYDSGLAMTSIKAAQDLYKLSDSVSGISVKVDDIYAVDKIKNILYSEVNGIGQYEIRTWVDANKNFLAALKLEKIVMFIVVTMTTVVAAFGIASTLIMSVLSRIKDIGIMRSVGAKTGSVLQVFVFQGMTIGLTGITLGLVGGLTLAFSLNRIVDFISHLIGRSLIPKDVYYFDRIPTYINPTDIGLIVFSALLISFLASIYPAYYASRITPAEAVRHE
ncbi:MAG: ABC transporter permease [Candidatus Omnitrophica bacterium]|jgi:lipoprotein-releasing system permease protein|nr:ABC transporter permease [Candidatus Omnitrophota bacterium]